MMNVLGPRYMVAIGRLRKDRQNLETLAQCFRVVADQAALNIVDPRQAKQIRVFDRDPGWLHPIFDSRESQ